MKTGSFDDFVAHTLAVARGERRVEPKVWIERRDDGASDAVRFHSLEAGVKLLSARNRALLQLIVTHRPQSVSELATLAQRAPQNVQRTLRPELAARKVHIEIDLAAGA